MDQRAELADAVRRLIAASVRNEAPEALLGEVAAEIGEQAERLERHALDHRPEGQGDGMAARMPFDAVIGRCNPLAVPVVLDFDGEVVRGRARFTAPYEGPPDCVQGGIIAACFDIVLSAATFIHDAAGPTISLTLRYRKPTKLWVESVFEAALDRREGVRSHAAGRLVQDGVVTVEAEAVFANIGRQRTRRLGR